MYKAARADGTLYEGEREAVDRFALYRELKKEGETVLSARTEKREHRSALFKHLFTFSRGIGTEEKIVFTRNLGGMLDAGLSLSRALAVLLRQTKNKQLRTVLGEVESDVRRGETLSASLAKYPSTFPSLYVSVVRSGEESGSLAKSLASISGQMEKSHELQKKVRGALLYPAIIVCVMVVIGILMLIYVVPSLTSTFRDLNVDLPATTQAVIFISDFLKNNVLLSLVMFIALGFGIYLMSRSEKGKRVLDALILRTPLIGNLVRETNTARTAQTLSSLIVAGVDVVISLSITKDVLQNSHYKDVLADAEEGIKKGAQMSAIFAKYEKIYPPFLSEMMAVGEETGTLAEMLRGVAEFYEKEVERKTKDMATVIEPFLMVFIGIVVGFFAIAMITPIYSVMNNV